MRLRVTLGACLALAVMCGTGSWQNAVADAPGSSAASKSDSPKTPADSQSAEGTKSGTSGERRKSLPTYFGSLGISDAQRGELQVIQDDYEVKLQKLRDEIKLLSKERDQKLEQHLTEGQRIRLKELRTAEKDKEPKKKKEAKAEK